MFNGVSTRCGGKFKTIIAGVLIGIASTLISMLIFAAAVYFLGLDRAFSVPLATVSISVGSFFAAYFIAKRTGHRGYLIGILVGLISFAAVTIISLITNNNGLSANTVFHLIIILLASAIGGIAGVNKGKNKKII